MITVLQAEASPAAAAVADDRAGLQKAFAGTVVSTYPDGRTAKLWLKADGGFASVTRRGTKTAGHWAIKGAKICLKQSRPFYYPFAWCTPLVSGGYGTTWTGKAPTGEPIRLTLVAGRSGEP